MLPFEISARSIATFEQAGLFQNSDILEDGFIEESFDNDLIRAIHWFSVAQDQTDLETMTVYFITCIETLVGRAKGEPISAHAAEAVAMVLGQTLDHRKMIRERVRAAYDVRSKVSHGDEAVTTGSEVKSLRSLVVHLISKLLSWREGLRNRADLLDWLLDARLSDTPVDPPRLIPTLGQMRETRKWNVEDLAEMSRLSREQIEAYERNGIPRDGAALLKLANAFEVSVFEFPKPRESRWISVQGHEYFLLARRGEDGSWRSSVDTWNPSTAML